jgi:CRP-like cAMP-binding protein
VARDEKLEQLRRVPLFAGMGHSDIERLGAIAESVDVPDGQVLTREGAPGREFFIVLAGRVRISQGDRAIRELGAGDFLGEIALIDGKPRTATAIADGPTHLLVVDRSGFLALMDSYPSVRLSVLEALASRLRAHEPATS